MRRFVMLPKDVYVFVTEICREAVVAEDGSFRPGREVPQGAVLKMLEEFPNYDGKSRDLCRCRVVRSPSKIIGAGQQADNTSRIVKDDEIVLYMKECVRVLKTDLEFQEEVAEFEKGPQILIAQNMEQAIDKFVRE